MRPKKQIQTVFTASLSVFDSQEGFKKIETTTSMCERHKDCVLQDGNKSRNRFYRFPADCEEAMGKMRRWKHELNKSIVHSWESGEARV